MFRSGSVKLQDAICIKQTHLLTNSTITMTLASYRVTHICVSKLTIIGSDNGSSPGRHWNIVNSKLGNRLHWNLKRNSYIFIPENAFENTVCEITVGELRSNLCTKTPLYIYVRSGSPSVCSFVDRIVSALYWIHFIFAHLIKQFQKVCRV